MFLHLVLTRMRKEAKLLKVDLKPFYLEEVGLYNTTIPDSEGGVVYSPIPQWTCPSALRPSPLPKTSPILSREKMQTDETDEAQVKLACFEIEQIMVNFTKEQVADFNTKIDGL